MKLKPFLLAQKKLILMTIALVPLVSALNLLQPYLMKVAIDSYILKKNYAGLQGIALIFLTVFVLEYILNFYQVYLMQLTGQKIVYDLRRALFEKVQSLDASFFDKTPVGMTLTRLTGDCEVINELFASGIVSLGWDLFRVILAAAAMSFLNWRLTLVTLAVLPVLLAFVLVFRRLLQRGYDRVRERYAEMNIFIQEHISGMRIVQLFRRERRASGQFAEINRNYRDAVMQTVRYDAILYALVEALSSIAIGLMIWYGARGMVQGAITFGVLVAFIEYIQRFFTPIRDLSSKFAVIQSARVAIGKISSLLEMPVSITSPEKPVNAAPFRERIELDQVSFHYHPGKPVLNSISLEIRRGERVAFVGVTGSGKSTLFKLLNRTHDVSEGEIRIDNVPLRQFDLGSLRALFGVVPQDVFLFAGTVEENIRLFRPDVTHSEVEAAARRIGTHELFARLPQGYSYRLNQGGTNLSMGERQLVALTRAVVFSAPILLLDEATANIDPGTLQVLLGCISRLPKEQTLIVAAHRLATIQSMDRVFVLHQGKLQESGSPEELYRRGGVYAHLFNMESWESSNDFRTPIPA